MNHIEEIHNKFTRFRKKNVEPNSATIDSTLCEQNPEEVNSTDVTASAFQSASNDFEKCTESTFASNRESMEHCNEARKEHHELLMKLSEKNELTDKDMELLQSSERGVERDYKKDSENKEFLAYILSIVGMAMVAFLSRFLPVSKNHAYSIETNDYGDYENATESDNNGVIDEVDNSEETDAPEE